MQPRQVPILGTRVILSLVLLLLLIFLFASAIAILILKFLILAIIVSEFNQSLHLSVYVRPQRLIIMVILVLLEMHLQLLDLAALEKLHGHRQLLAALLGGAHQLQLVVQGLEHILLLLSGAADLLITDVVDLKLDLSDTTLHLLLNKLIKPLLIQGQLDRRIRSIITSSVIIVHI